MKSMIPITRFNRGEASRIFDEVASSGTKIVVKNNRPACVLMSPEQYTELMELLSDYILLDEAERRMAGFDAGKTVSQAEVMREFGLTQADLDGVDVELE
ncbi:MAG TPA: type II toxin-antitoxin system Phd/YefM family antitoxin [Candidatus Scatomorpha merdipullorum]|uniref:Antitoxin n=1 Tax=Candidatus Scatomorpha merdipullorum TaxID=2840927 RepID=A0A9D1JVG5_9FIRM|nr:type II toxin-antitoxin system Phd/YefM family antitoxin [Candidatus Scatomorpha merdipullorum]